MQLKANLHLHTADDPKDFIPYTLYEAVDQAAALGFQVLALTCHGFFAWREEYSAYAAKKGILLIPGIEASLMGPSQFIGRHVLLLNCDKSAERIRNFEDLKNYRRTHPETVVIAPHPFYPYPFHPISLKEHLEKHIKLFDVIELSWFYSRLIRRANKKATAIAQKYNLPLIATSDTHDLKQLGFSFAIINAREKTITSVLDAVRAGEFQNKTTPRRFLKDMVWGYIVRKLIMGDLVRGGRRKPSQHEK